MTKKSLGALALSALFACSAWATETGTWKYYNTTGQYSIDETNGIYTDSKGYTIFNNSNISGNGSGGLFNYSNKEMLVRTAGNAADRYTVDQTQVNNNSALFINKSSISNADFSNSSYVVDAAYIENNIVFSISADSSLMNVDFSGSTFSYTGGDSNTIGYGVISYGTMNNVDFSGSTFSVKMDNNLAGAAIYLSKSENVNLSNSNISVGVSDILTQQGQTPITLQAGIGIAIGDDASELNISNSKIDAQFALNASDTSCNFVNLNAQNTQFINTQRLVNSATLECADFRGATMNSTSVASTDISGVNVTNALLGDGEIYSATGSDSENLGLVLEEGETFTVRAYTVPSSGDETEATNTDETIAAKLTVDSLVKGTIEIEVGADGNGKLLIAEGTKLTLSESAQIVVKLDDSASEVAGNELDLNTILAFEDGASLAIEGAEEGMTAEQALLSKISAQSMNGDALGNVTFSGTESFVQNVVVPEPSAFGLLAGIGALALVAARRRRSR